MIKIGHRGAAGYEPENTLRSFQKAIDLGADMIEFDVRRTKDGEIIVIHDDKVNRTTDGRGFVNQLSLDEIKELDAGKGERIPTLKEALDFINQRAKVNIELKDDVSKEAAQIIDHYIKNKGWHFDDFLVSSFDVYRLEEIKSVNPDILVGVLFDKLPKNYFETCQKLPAYSINIKYKNIKPAQIIKIRENGFKIFVWTDDKIKDIERLKKAGVDGILNNYPDRI